MKKALIAIIAGGILVGTILNAHTLRDRVAWTDRNVGSSVSAPASDLAPTLERFWNVQMEELPSSAPASSAISTPAVSQRNDPPPKMEASQTREVHEHHGHWGINLFNLIPVIDIVHGEESSDSSDRVEGRR